MDSQSQRVLQSILQRESRSLLLYVGEAYPWAAGQHADAGEALRQLIQEEKEALAALGHLMSRRRVPLPALGVFPGRFTTINFVALDYLLPHLLAAQQLAIADLEHDLAALVGSEARTQVQQLLESKRRHALALECLAKRQPQGTAS